MIEVEKITGKIAVVWLNNPPLNIITLEMTRELKDLFSALEEDREVKVVILTGKGEKAFSAGADIKEFSVVRDQVIEKKLRKENEAFLRIEKLSKPVIAAMNGLALGGGCEMALACDIRILAEEAKIGLPEINLGVFPGSGGIYRLPGIVGLSKALELLYLGEPVSAKEAFRIGLVNRLAKKEEVISVALKMAEKIAQYPAASLSSIKLGVRKSFEQTQEEAIEYTLRMSDKVFKSEACAEGIKAFFEKRKPDFDKFQK